VGATVPTPPCPLFWRITGEGSPTPTPNRKGFRTTTRRHRPGAREKRHSQPDRSRLPARRERRRRRTTTTGTTDDDRTETRRLGDHGEESRGDTRRPGVGRGGGRGRGRARERRGRAAGDCPRRRLLWPPPRGRTRRVDDRRHHGPRRGDGRPRRDDDAQPVRPLAAPRPRRARSAGPPVVGRQPQRGRRSLAPDRAGGDVARRGVRPGVAR